MYQRILVPADGSATAKRALQAVRQTGERTLGQAAEEVHKSCMTAETAQLEASGERISSVIKSEADNWEADLIVIGTHGRSGLNRWLLGSVAAARLG